MSSSGDFAFMILPDISLEASTTALAIIGESSAWNFVISLDQR